MPNAPRDVPARVSFALVDMIDKSEYVANSVKRKENLNALV